MRLSAFKFNSLFFALLLDDIDYLISIRKFHARIAKENLEFGSG